MRSCDHRAKYARTIVAYLSISTIFRRAFLNRECFRMINLSALYQANTGCSCPPGTQYQQEMTFGAIGGSASDVRAVTVDCSLPQPGSQSAAKPHPVDFKTAWLGMVPINTNGKERRVYQHSHHPRYHHFSRKGM